MLYRLTYPANILAIASLLTLAMRRMDLYIHPRYFVFSACMSIIYLIFMSKKLVDSPSKSTIIGTVLIALILIYPSGYLSANIAVNRAQEAKVNTISRESVYNSYATDLSHLSFGSWYSLISGNGSSATVLGKKAKLTGFVVASNDQYTTIGRYVLTCCAVDATPITIDIRIVDQASKILQRDTWLEVEGEFNDVNGRKLLQVTKLNMVEEPANPYE
jgi:uncharacterized repeat protein (TIGR03943 family)